jgi:hypothetical protein
VNDVAQNNISAEHVAESDVLRHVSGGEWSASDHLILGAKCKPDEIIIVGRSFGDTPEEALANACLMAAAKDMAEALRLNLESFNDENDVEKFDKARKATLAALKKAGAA